VVQVRDEPAARGQPSFSIVADGSPLNVPVRVNDTHTVQGASGELAAFGSIQSVTLDLPATSARELKVWAHRITPEGNSEGLSASVEVLHSAKPEALTLSLVAGQITTPFTGEACEVRIVLGPT
jgi:hypothetical protein